MSEVKLLLATVGLVIATNLALMILFTLDPDLSPHPLLVIVGFNGAVTMPVRARIDYIWKELSYD